MRKIMKIAAERVDFFRIFREYGNKYSVMFRWYVQRSDIILEIPGRCCR